MPHVLHLLITVVLSVFTFGIGGVVWLIIWLYDAMSTSPLKGPPFRCGHCGQAAEVATPPAAIEAQKRIRACQIAANLAREEQRAARGATLERAGSIVAGMLEWVRGLVVGALAWVCSLPARLDLAVRTAAGGDNDLIYWFLWSLLGVGAVAGCTMTVVWLL